jgi:hypothetical protein
VPQVVAGPAHAELEPRNVEVGKPNPAGRRAPDTRPLPQWYRRWLARRAGARALRPSRFGPISVLKLARAQRPRPYATKSTTCVSRSMNWRQSATCSCDPWPCGPKDRRDTEQARPYSPPAGVASSRAGSSTQSCGTALASKLRPVGRRGGWLSEDFNRDERLAGLQAVMQLAEHLAEHVSQCGLMAPRQLRHSHRHWAQTAPLSPQPPQVLCMVTKFTKPAWCRERGINARILRTVECA